MRKSFKDLRNLANSLMEMRAKIDQPPEHIEDMISKGLDTVYSCCKQYQYCATNGGRKIVDHGVAFHSRFSQKAAVFAINPTY